MGVEPQINMQAFRDGDNREFEKVVDIYNRTLTFFAEGITKNKPEAEDIVIISFHKLFQICSAFENESNIKAFLFITVKNRCINYLISRKRWIIKNREAGYLLRKEQEAETLGKLDEAALLQILMKAIESLPKSCQLIFKLYFIEDMSRSEIAKMLDTNKGNVNAHISNARAIIKRFFR